MLDNGEGRGMSEPQYNCPPLCPNCNRLHHGPCVEYWRSLYEKAEYQKMNYLDSVKLLEAELLSVKQVTGELCDICGWAMKFPGEKCRCELAKENEGYRDQIDLLTQDNIAREAIEMNHLEIIKRLQAE